MKRHGTNQYFLLGEGVLSQRTIQNGLSPFARTIETEEAPPLDTERMFRFSRMFNLPEFRPPDAALIALGAAMEDSANVTDHPAVPAGYTYLGQFVDHDITSDPTGDIPTGSLSPEEIINGRTPSLDLDSIYGRGPILEQKAIYETDRIRLKIGNTTPTNFGDADFSLPNDLPRTGGGGSDARIASIGDPRNDENLAVAQTHLAFLKAHNKLVDFHSQNGLSGNSLFEAAKADVVRHYQWIVLHDFLPKISRGAVITDVLQNGRRFYLKTPGQEVSMPVEFSVAAYRLGHSMIRNEYEWNRIFRTRGPGPVASLRLLFTFTGLSGDLAGEPTLPSNWIIDWLRFFDFSPSHPIHPEINKIRRIDESLAFSLKSIPGFPTGPMSNLAVRNLLRGRLLGLPTGQAVAHAIGEQPMSEEEVLTGPHEQILRQHGLGNQTPLWYYVLKEAQTQEGGERLGAVGSRILAEVFVGLIENSRISILDGSNWRPTLPSRRPDSFDMADLLLFIDDLNPLE